jgi:hypothetical protein
MTAPARCFFDRLLLRSCRKRKPKRAGSHLKISKALKKLAIDYMHQKFTLIPLHSSLLL